jgi:C2H2 transcription facotor
LLTLKRKHTGERPFQCHCARRFSRLDNLRQHAQTVHVNEEIPGDSLAATGTRFQRQIRTDRVRPPGARARASTAGSQGPHHHRGHTRNLSTSSIGSTTSNASTISTVSTLSRENSGRRPNSISLVDQSPRGRLTIDTLRTSPNNSNYSYTNQLSSGGSTPTSYGYSNTPSSPFGSTLGSPIAISRNNGPWGDRAISRRLSVPSGVNPFQPSHTGVPGPPYLNQPLQPSSQVPTTTSSIVASPTSSTYSYARNDIRNDSRTDTDADWRRRTWHPTTYSTYANQRPATSGLSYSQTPDAPRPAFAPQALTAAGQTPKLPGFETFDQISRRPATPPQQTQPSNPPQATSGRLSLFPSTDRPMHGSGHTRNHLSWDLSLHQNLTKLEIAGGTPPKENTSPWGQQTMADIQNAANSSSQNFTTQQQPSTQPLQPPQAVQKRKQSEPQPQQTIPLHGKRNGWYPGLANISPQITTAQRPSPGEDSSSSDGIPTPSSSMDYQPTIIHANGYIEPQPVQANHVCFCDLFVSCFFFSHSNIFLEIK